MAKAKPGSTSSKVPPRPSTTRARPSGARPSGKQEAQRRRRNRRTLAIVASVVVVIVIVVLVVVGLSSSSSKNSEVRTPVSQSQLSQLSSIPVSTLVAAANVASPSTVTPPANLPATVPALTSNGKPEILYAGAEYCPFCAAERWPMVMALSKFGTFTNLASTKSSSTDTNANTPTFSFYGSSYTSPYLQFTSVELQNRSGKTLQTPTANQKTLIDTYDAPPYVASSSANSIPFVDLGGKFVISGTEYDAAPIAGKSFDSTVPYMLSATNPTSRSAEAVAGHLVGVICALTNDQPSNVCSQVPASLKTGAAVSANQGSSSGS